MSADQPLEHPARQAAEQGIVLPRRPRGNGPCGKTREEHGIYTCRDCREVQEDLNRYRRRNRVSPHLAEWIIRRDGGICRACHSPKNLIADHDVPLSRGGLGDPDNLITLCRSCNSSKRDHTLSEWLAKGGRR